ncbi:hypothetical protein [Mycolicibacterium fortuitum]|uniref:hypothetical protein n=1 Tax=Mycolicibacterium fortuitum TaxID=1766 RepID=UPI0026225099|nr:hypothetical protein [Mycolicibacterium fortuitum]
MGVAAAAGSDLTGGVGADSAHRSFGLPTGRFGDLDHLARAQPAILRWIDRPPL